jgi:hypothetical protein
LGCLITGTPYRDLAERLGKVKIIIDDLRENVMKNNKGFVGVRAKSANPTYHA